MAAHPVCLGFGHCSHTSGISTRDTPVNVGSMHFGRFKSFVMVVITVGCVYCFIKPTKLLLRFSHNNTSNNNN